MKPNEPAFPRDHRYDGHNGMTMRQFYKAAALQGIVASHANPAASLPTAKEAASIAAKFADAMLAEDAAHEKGDGA